MWQQWAPVSSGGRARQARVAGAGCWEGHPAWAQGAVGSVGYSAAHRPEGPGLPPLRLRPAGPWVAPPHSPVLWSCVLGLPLVPLLPA